MNSKVLPVLKIHNIFSGFLYLACALMYALLLASFPNELFRDRDSYVNYAAWNIDILDNYSGLSVFFNEPFFLLYNYLLSFAFRPESVPQITVFIISFSFSFVILKKSRNLFVTIFALLSLVFISYSFHQQLVVLRQGLATAVLLWVVYFWPNKLKLIFFTTFLLGFIHTSFFIIFFVLCSDNLLKKILPNFKFRVLFLISIIFISSLFMLKVADFLGVRQATSSHVVNNENGGGGFLLFLFMLLTLFFHGFKRVLSSVYGYITLIGLVIYLGFYFTIPVSGRVVGTFIPFYLIYIASNFYPKVFFPYVLFFIVNILLFYYSVTGGSLTLEGVEYLNKLLRL